MVRSTRKDAHAWLEQYQAAKQEHAACKAARAAGQPMPPTPNMDAMKERQAMATGTTNKGTGAGRSVRLSDTELEAQCRALIAEGFITKGAIVKRLREIGKGSNDKRVGKAFAAVVAADGAPAKPKADAAKEAKATESIVAAVVESAKSGPNAHATAAAKTASKSKAAKATKSAAAKRAPKPKAATTRKGAATAPLAKPPAPRKTAAAAKTTKRVSKRA